MLFTRTLRTRRSSFSLFGLSSLCAHLAFFAKVDRLAWHKLLSPPLACHQFNRRILPGVAAGSARGLGLVHGRLRCRGVASSGINGGRRRRVANASSGGRGVAGGRSLFPFLARTSPPLPRLPNDFQYSTFLIVRRVRV